MAESLSGPGVYLDYNANHPLRPCAAEAFSRAGTLGANPSSGHSRGAAAKAVLEDARRRVARHLGIRRSELVFTSGGTESNNLALRGLFAARAPRDTLIVTATEHPAVRATADALRSVGAAVEIAPVDSSGLVDLAWLADHIGDHVAIVAVMLANNETGVIQPIEQVASLCAQAGVPLHCDAVQATGKIPVDLAALGVATGAVTAHKFGGPIGIGGLFVSKDWRVIPQITGGGQEHGLRGGTTAYPLASAMAAALDEAVSELLLMDGPVRALRDRLETAAGVLCSGRVVQGGGASRLPNTSLLTFPGLDAPQTMATLDGQGIRVGTGAACHTGQPSAVLTAMGASAAEAHATLRFSLGCETTGPEIERTIAALRALI